MRPKNANGLKISILIGCRAKDMRVWKKNWSVDLHFDRFCAYLLEPDNV